MKNTRFILIAVSVLFLSIQAEQTLALEIQTIRYEESDEAIANPLKGWVVWGEPYRQHPQPSTLFFALASWRELEPVEGEFAFDSWEERIWKPWVDRGMKAIFRIYVDYPNRQTGMPQWLLDAGVGQTRYEDYGGGWSPDYSHPLFLEKARALISALGERYDQDPRVAFLDVGILGYWGEWHTYPNTQLFASSTVQRGVMDVFMQAFPNKKMMLRTPSVYSAKQRFGYRDDCFPSDTEGPESWKFLPSLRSTGAAEVWKQQPIGGEFCNGAQGALNETLNEPERVKRLIREGHFSHMGPAGGSIAPANGEHQRQLDEMLKSFGYRFTIRSATFPIEITNPEEIPIQISLENSGATPFYYPWPIEYHLIDAQKQSVYVHTSSADIRNWLPGSHLIQDVIPSVPEIQPGVYQLGIRIPDPSGQGPSIRLANREEGLEDTFILGTLQVVQGNHVPLWKKHEQIHE